MILLIGFAFLSGIITILSPCILPVLPIILAGSAGNGQAPHYQGAVQGQPAARSGGANAYGPGRESVGTVR